MHVGLQLIGVELIATELASCIFLQRKTRGLTSVPMLAVALARVSAALRRARRASGIRIRSARDARAGPMSVKIAYRRRARCVAHGIPLSLFFRLDLRFVVRQIVPHAGNRL